MKKIVLLIATLLFCLSLAFPAFADILTPPITDGAGYLTSSQLEEISGQLEEIRLTYNFDVAVYTEAVMSGYDAESTADNLFDYGGYGCGENADGMILYISADPREYHFSTHGSGLTVFNDNGLAYLERQILPALQEDDYYTAMKLYAEYSEELLEMAAQGEPFNQKQYSLTYLLGVVAGALLLPLLLAFYMMRQKLSKMKTAVEQNYAANYLKPGSMKLDASSDVFLYSTMTKTEKPKSDSGGHISSSGERHGGRGGSF